MSSRHPLACILPPDLLRRVAENVADEERQRLLRNVELDQRLRQRRNQANLRTPALRGLAKQSATAGTPNRKIYDQKNSEDETPGTLVRSEGDPAVEDASVNQAYDNFGATYAFYWEVFKRDSIDNQGLEIDGLVHFGQNYPNAFWDGNGHMFFGDGDGQTLLDTTKGLDVIGHELTHGVTQYEANLTYQGQSGALNESLSDVFGSLIKQYQLKQSAADADWLIGADIVGPQLQPALRSMKAPGTANPSDTQPADMDGFVETTEDDGGVHINSGIPNRAFYVAATTIGGNAWEAAGQVWYASLADEALQPGASFSDFAAITVNQAKKIFGDSSDQANAVTTGWDAVKVALP